MLFDFFSLLVFFLLLSGFGSLIHYNNCRCSKISSKINVHHLRQIENEAKLQRYFREFSTLLHSTLLYSQTSDQLKLTQNRKTRSCSIRINRQKESKSIENMKICKKKCRNPLECRLLSKSLRFFNQFVHENRTTLSVLKQQIFQSNRISSETLSFKKRER